MSEYVNGASDPLLEPAFLKPGMACRNRVAMAAMTHYSAPEDGSVGEAELAYIERRSSRPPMVKPMMASRRHTMTASCRD